jgi:tetratricopeptide (TPR) repeat protein
LKVAAEYLKGGAVAKAERYLQVVLRHDPNNWLAWAFLANLWLQHKCGGLDTGGFPTAKRFFQRALEIKPDAVELMNNLAIAHRRRDEHDEAIRWFRHALGMSVSANVLSNIGSCLLDMGKPAESETFLRRALLMATQHGDANWNLALSLLAQRKWQEGWDQHDWGFRAKERGLRPYVEYWPGWHGQPLEGKTLLIWGEQGIGDEILFAGCFSDLRKLKPKEVVFDCHPRLERLWRRSFPWMRVYGKRKDPDFQYFYIRAAAELSGLERTEIANVMETARRTNAPSDALYPKEDGGGWVRLSEVPDALQRQVRDKVRDQNVFARWGVDYHIPIGTLPKFFRRADGDFPKAPFLKADEKKVREYKEKYPTETMRIGLSWQGGSNKTAKHRRSIPLEKFGEILKLPATWISLQYGDVEAEVQKVNRQFGTNLIHDNYAIEDLDEQAALTKACSLVITAIQTSVHMAGALGVPTWCLVCTAPPWKFHDKMDERDTLLWHPAVRMIRQEGDEWPLEKLRSDLQLLLASPQKDTRSTDKSS